MLPMIRNAVLTDAGGILPIYNHAVVETTAVWNERLSDLPAREAWLQARIDAGFPVLVADVDGTVAGFASYGDFRAFDGYRHTVEHSVYVDPTRHRQGIGRILLAALIERARAQDKHAMIAGIESGNGGSIALHESFGFVEVGRMPQVGAKFGRWLDLVFLQLTLDERTAP